MDRQDADRRPLSGSEADGASVKFSFLGKLGDTVGRQVQVDAPAIDRTMVVAGIQVASKTDGTSRSWQRSSEQR